MKNEAEAFVFQKRELFRLEIFVSFCLNADWR
jgi:hypothetical protein